MSGCKECGDSGIIMKDEKTFECQCSMLRRLASSMPVRIRSATVTKEHVLHPIVAKINKHLFISAALADIEAIIKVIIYKNPNLFIRITDDIEIRDVGVGSTSRKSRGDGAEVVYNSLHEFVEPPNLLILKLGRLKYKNKAAPGLLEEAITIRVDQNRWTWIFSDKNEPFGPGSHAFSESLWTFICSSMFERIDIPRITNVETFTTSSPTRYIEPESNNQNIKRESKRQVESSDDEKPSNGNLNMFGSGIKPKKRY